MRFAEWAPSVLFGAIVFCAADQSDAAPPKFGQAEISLNGKPAPPASSSVCGFTLVARPEGPQIALTKQPPSLLASLHPGEQAAVAVPIRGVAGPFSVTARAALFPPQEAEVSLSLDGAGRRRAALGGAVVQLEVVEPPGTQGLVVRLLVSVAGKEAAVCLRGIRLGLGDRWLDIPVSPGAAEYGSGPPPLLPTLRRPIEEALIEWDWRMQDGIDTAREPSTYAAAIERTLQRGEALSRDLRAGGDEAAKDKATQWQQLRQEWKELSAAATTEQPVWEGLWRRVHSLRRRIALGNPLARLRPLLFVKQVPGMFSHQLTQYQGSNARPGGGIFVLDAPGKSLECRQLAAGELPAGSYQHAEVSFDAQRVLFSYCRAETTPESRQSACDRFYHLYEMAADGSGLRQLTDGPFDDIAPRYLPDGRIIFVSTRRGGFHRCGRGPCATHTLAIANADGSNPHPVSFHETHEWDPAVLHDGRVIYTRWDYVDRHAVYYEQLWSVRADGSDVRIFFGNNTFNPVGIWEARPVPGSNRVMATAAAHHAMTAGSIILVDVTRGVDGPEPITRLTPDALFPESEAPVVRETSGHWHAPAGLSGPPAVPPEAARWPGHCYRSPCPLSETYFLAAYSFDSLIGEPTANPANMFGIYLVDRFGNKELLYRDLNIASLWPTPLRPRRRPPLVPSLARQSDKQEGTFFLRNAHVSWPPLPAGSVKRLRIVQVLPKSTPHANTPRVGIPNASPGKQVLGTVPVERDGSAYFRAPAGIPLAFQVLDEHGQALQVMRSLTYLQPGENAACVGCHEHRMTAPPPGRFALALSRPPSTIEPAPDGSKPLCYPILVQPVLDKHCVRCHNPQKPEGKVVLTGEPQGHYTVSYNALAHRVAYSCWGGRPGDFRQVNNEPLSTPGQFGALGSPLMKMLLAGHEEVELSPAEIDRLTTWMDANALFYGTFDPEDQARQQRGERIEGPEVE